MAARQRLEGKPLFGDCIVRSYLLASSSPHHPY